MHIFRVLGTGISVSLSSFCGKDPLLFWWFGQTRWDTCFLVVKATRWNKFFSGSGNERNLFHELAYI